MVKLIINNQKVSVPEGTTIMEAAKNVGIYIPHLCFLKEINEIGACRVCLVEVEGMDKLVTACNTQVREGMKVITNSPRLRRTRLHKHRDDTFRPRYRLCGMRQKRQLHFADHSQRHGNNNEPLSQHS